MKKKYSNHKYAKYEEKVQELYRRHGWSDLRIATELSEANPGVKVSGLRSSIRNHGWLDGVEYNSAADTFEGHLADQNFTPPENWSHGWLKMDDASIFVKNNKSTIPFGEMRKAFINDIMQYVPDHTPISRKPVSDPHLFVIDIADLHIGKYGSASETGGAYNSDIAVQRAIAGVEGLLRKASGFNIDQIIFVIGNDVLHTDNAQGTTTSGTRQDTDKAWHENYIIARNVYIRIIEMLLKVADVHVVHNPSNHDYVTGFMLADSIYCFFNKHENITFDVEQPAHRKYYVYGKNLIGTSHGDGAKMDLLPLLMAEEARQEWGKAHYKYIYLHHIHHKQYYKFKGASDYPGVTVEYMRSPSGTDSWHHRNGYCHAPKAIEGFIHSKKQGQVARLTHLFK